MEETKKTKFKRRLIIFLVILLWSVWTWVPYVERISLDLIAENSTTVRIVLVTDLHSCYYGPKQKWLTKLIDKEEPDIVVLAGDIFDDKLKDKNAKKLVENLVSKYPCYYVTGNHEFWSGRVDEMKLYLKNIGVHVLEGNCETVNVNGVMIDICGVDDPTYLPESEWQKQIEAAYAQTDPSHVRILASHRPEKVEIYEKFNFDLILSGHAHAGQVRIPFANKGVFAPDQGFFAKYVNGLYNLNNGSVLEVSRGLARESTPLPRYFNHPEIVSIELR